MARLSSARLGRLHEFILDVHAARDVETLRRTVPRGLASLVACDRAAFNEFTVDAERLIMPWPKPSYWDRYGPVITKHLHEHALANPKLIPTPHRAVTFGDLSRQAPWRKSTLYREYYLPVGAKEQLGVHLFQAGPTRYLLNCNRWGRDFSGADRVVLEIASRHVKCAWLNAAAITALQQIAVNASDGRRRSLLLLDFEDRAMEPFSRETRESIRKYFGREMGGSRVLPASLRRWVIACREAHAAPETAMATPAPLTVRRPDGVLTVRIGQIAPVMTVLVLQEQLRAPRGARPAVALTGREREVLQWLAEGKRNAEIGAILGLSSRTVGKHLEHIFEKLGVETRTAAARAAGEMNY